MKFEGEYLNELKNGKGIEYYQNNNKPKFKGEYLNGEKNGKGIEYYENNNKPKFEGEYLNGKRWNGKEYDEDGNIIYELKNGNGYIKEFYSKGKLLFEGEYKNGKKMENLNFMTLKVN